MDGIETVADTSAVDDDGLIVNKRELAKILECSLPTIDALLDRYGDRFPVLRKGSNGVEWAFSADAVVAFLAAEKELEAQEEQSRQDLFKQFTLPINEIVAEDAPPGVLTPTQRLNIAKARQAEHKLAQEAGFLIRRDELRIAMTPAFQKLARFLASLPKQVARAHGLPDEIERHMQTTIQDAQRLFVKEVRDFIEASATSSPPSGDPAADRQVLHAAE